MVRSSRRRQSSLESFLRRVIMVLVTLAVVLLGFRILATEYPLLALVLLLAGVAAPTSFWRQRRLARQSVSTEFAFTQSARQTSVGGSYLVVARSS